MSANVEIIIKTVADDKGTKKASDNLKDLAKTAAKIGGTLAAVGIAFKKAFDLGQQGAQINVLRQSFDRLGGDLGGLRRAAQGTISDFDLMNATNTLLIGTSGQLRQEFLKNSDQLLRIAKAANTLNPALGDTTFLYESIARGIKRSSPLILDNLGLTIKIGEANEKYAAQLGKTVQELTAEEQQMALLNETLRSGNDLIAQSAGVSTEQLDSYARLSAAMSNLMDKLKRDLADGPLSDLVAALADSAEELNSYKDAVEVFDKALSKGIITQEKYNDFLSGGARREAERTRTVDELQEKTIQYAYTLQRALYAEEDSIAAKRNLITIEEDQVRMMHELGIATTNVAMAQEDYVGSIGVVAEETGAVAEQIERANDAFEEMLGYSQKDWAKAFSGIAEAAQFGATGAGPTLEGLEGMFKEIAGMFAGGGGGETGLGLFSSFLDDATLAAYALQVELKNITIGEAATQASQELGIYYWDAYKAITSIEDAAERLDGLKVEMQFMLDVISNGYVPGLQSGAYTPQATGGPLSPFALVGEQGPEMIINGVVIPADMTRKMMQLGMKPNQKLASGGQLLDGTFGGVPTVTTAPPKKLPETAYKPTASSFLSPDAALIAQEQETQAAQLAAMQYTQEQAVSNVSTRVAARIEKSNQILANKLDELIGTVLTEDGANRSFKQALRTVG